jgi:hypothetical protein
LPSKVKEDRVFRLRLIATPLFAAAVITAVVVTAVGTAGTANADPATRFDTSSNPSDVLQVGVDIAPGLWVGTAVESGYPGNCSLIRFRNYPPQYTADGVAEWPMSDFETPLTYRITPGGAVKLGRGCIWVRIAP